MHTQNCRRLLRVEEDSPISVIYTMHGVLVYRLQQEEHSSYWLSIRECLVRYVERGKGREGKRGITGRSIEYRQSLYDEIHEIDCDWNN